MSNAFNMVSRQAVLDECETFFPELLLWVPWCYGSHTICCGTLWVRIVLSQEYSKRDPLGPVLFALVILKLVTMIDAVDLLVDTWYLEDGVLVGDRSAVSRALHRSDELGLHLGLHINFPKCKLFSREVAIHYFHQW